MSIYYKPEDGWAADCIPFFWQGEYHLFYLKDYRNTAEHGEGTPWFHLTTQDFVSFTDRGEALRRGTPDEQDLFVFTGCVFEHQGRFHIFYTGHNPHFRALGKPEQGVMHAVSPDLLHWEKVPEDTFYAPPDLYEPHDWRDPFVFWNDETGEFNMLLAARLRSGPSGRRGCTALCASSDLRHWEVRDPLWAPGLYYTHECPDLFRQGQWWYLIFSEFSAGCLTRYRMSRTLAGPWVAPANDSFDGRAFYAAKTASDGHRRFAIGWNPTREQERNDRRWQWGGSLVVHEVHQQPDGALTVAIPPAIAATYTRREPSAPALYLGSGTTHGQELVLEAADAFAFASCGLLPEECRITARLTFVEHTRGCGLLLRVSEEMESGYLIRIEPGRSRLVFDCWPRPGDLPFMVELERPVSVSPGIPIALELIVSGTICECYLDGTVAMSVRLYDLPRGTWGTESPTEGVIGTGLRQLERQPRGSWGLFVTEGRMSITALSLATLRV